MKHLRLLLLPLAVLLLSGPAHANPLEADEAVPSVLSQGKGGGMPPIKDEDGEEIKLPEYDDKQMQCVSKCQAPAGQCLNKCKDDDRRCNARCAQSMERCTRKCGIQLE